jgi:hypothetical protein
MFVHKHFLCFIRSDFAIRVWSARQMERFAKGMKVWADTQARLLPELRLRTDATKDALTPRDKRAIVLVEPRPHPALEFVIRNFRWFLPSWRIILVHGTDNERFVKEITTRIHGSFEYINCGVGDLPAKAYNTLFTRPSFWKALGDMEWVMIAQTDTMLMKPAEQAVEDLIERKLHFVGAPWSFSCGVCGGPLDGGCGHMIDQAVVASLAPDMVGNGGLSLRHVPSMLQALEKFRLEAGLVQELVTKWGPTPDSAALLKGTTNEDVFFCKAFKELGLTIADRNTGLQFAVEQIAPFAWNPVSDGPLSLGAHKPWAYLPDKLVKGMFDRVTL